MFAVGSHFAPIACAFFVSGNQISRGEELTEFLLVVADPALRGALEQCDRSFWGSIAGTPPMSSALFGQSERSALGVPDSSQLLQPRGSLTIAQPKAGRQMNLKNDRQRDHTQILEQKNLRAFPSRIRAE